MGKSFLHLKLKLEENGKTRNVFVEMTISEFYKFLHDLEKAKCNLDLLLLISFKIFDYKLIF